MKRNHPLPILLLLPLLLAGGPASAQEAAPDSGVIDDRLIKMQFEKGMGTLKDGDQAPDPVALQQQLKEREHHSLQLPEIAGLPQEASGGSQLSNLYSQRRDSVLCFGNIFKCDNCNKWHGNIAGGFVITANGVAVTNYHVMENAKAGAFGAMTFDGKVHLVEEVLAASKFDDLAIVKLAGDGFTPTPLARSAPVGSNVIAISHPEGRFYTVSEGIISRHYKQNTRKGSGPNRIAITADFAKGSSGCPVFSADGSVIGVIASTNSIYYNRDKDGTESNLQMVIKSCIPSAAVLRLLSAQEESKEDANES